METQSSNPFRRLFEIDVARYVEKKGQFNYLSWPYAVAQLRLTDAQAHWEVRRFAGLPYLVTDLGVFVEVAVTVAGVTLSQIHPVLDAKNRPIMAPTSFDINTSIQRCLVKAIALHGLGLSIYAGEDLPLGDAVDEPVAATAKTDKTPAKVASFPPPEPRTDTVTPAQVRYIERLIAETGTERRKVLDYCGVEQLDDITKSEASRVIRSLEQSRNRKEAA
ncbi:MAG: DUF1071 domain-containing protein [Zoogloeaceae bacterium]|nr:DUF1071 domain-containing protein [Zoogloeaceae bacterium]MCK6385517.1 DUF1071 domain-containing protein [Rhodocyclaceae bacterium]